MSKQPTPKASNELLISLSPKAMTNQFSNPGSLQITKKNSSPPQLKLQTDINYFEQNERAGKFAPNAYYTPQHRIYSQNEPMSADKVSFSQKLEAYNMNSLLLGSRNAGGYNKMYARPPESPMMGLKTTNFSINHGMQQSPRASLMKESHDLSHLEAQERLARMGFIERQEKVLNKYRPKLNSEGDVFNPQNMGGHSQMHTPKMMPRRQITYIQQGHQ